MEQSNQLVNGQTNIVPRRPRPRSKKGGPANLFSVVAMPPTSSDNTTARAGPGCAVRDRSAGEQPQPIAKGVTTPILDSTGRIALFKQ
jgi:hypothetical protein